MIISITGKPCSGKGTVGKIFSTKYNFEYLCTGDMFRAEAKKCGVNDILELQKTDKIKELDKIIDNQTIEIGKTRLNDNIIFDSRLAWFFIPNSFKVFIDIDWNEAGKRLLEANRENEKVANLNSAIKEVKDRWDTENNRYQEIYNTNNCNLNNYNLVIDSTHKTPEQICEEIHNAYINFLKSAN